MKKTKMLLLLTFCAALIISSGAYIYGESPEAAAQAASEQAQLSPYPTVPISDEQLTPMITPQQPVAQTENTAVPTLVPPPKATVEQATAAPTAKPDEDLPTPAATQQPSAQATEAATQQPSEEATQAPAQQEPVKAATPAVEEKVNKIEVDNSTAGEEEGIVILNPGETSTEELGKYIQKKEKTAPVGEEENNNGEVNVTFEGPDTEEGETGGVVLMEAEGANKIEKAGYVMVERAGFISDNFTEDGYIYDVDDREILVQGMPAYIKVTVGKGIRPGMQFLVYTDKENVEDIVTGEDKGKLIDVRAVGTIVEKSDEGIWLVRLLKSYGPVGQNFRIKLRKDFKDYYNKITTRIKKKTGVIEAFIIKVKDGIVNVKKKDIVYLNKGVKSGLMPGEIMTVYRSIPNKDTGGMDTYHKTGKLMVINSMKDSSVAIVTDQTGVINAGDMVKSAK